MTLRRTLRWLGVLTLAATIAALAPVAAIEGACRAPATTAPPVISDPTDRRPVTNSELSFPEWYIVYAYQDLAGILRTHDEAAFRYLPSIAGYWTSFCAVNRLATSRGTPELDEKIMLYVIGLSFTAEMAIKGAYETTIGAATAWLRGPALTPEDRFAHDMAADYAGFLQQTPWYEYGFTTRIQRLWREVPFTPSLRSAERRAALTMEWGGKALYAKAIAALAGLAPAQERIRSIVTGPGTPPDPRIQVVKILPGGALLIETPRYGAFTEILATLATAGWTVQEIAGNHSILVTALRRDDNTAPLPGTTQIFAMPVQSRPGWQRIGLDTAIPELTTLIRTLAGHGAIFEHAYDY